MPIKRHLAMLSGVAVLAIAPLTAANWDDNERSRAAATLDKLRDKALRDGSVRVIVQPVERATDGVMLRQVQAGQRARRFAATRGQRPLREYPRKSLQVYSLNASDLTSFATSGEFERIVEDALNAPTLMQSVPGIGADTAHSAGITGNGVAVAILDTGVDATHINFGGRVVEEACFSSTYAPYNSVSVCPGGQDTQFGTGAAAPCATDCAHGTHVASIVAGADGFVTGVAPDASVIAVQVFSLFNDQGICDPNPNDENDIVQCELAYDSDILAGLQYVAGLTSTHTVAAVNLSLGGGYFTEPCDGSYYKDTMDELEELGVATVAAAGNFGYVDAIGSPACVSTAIAVGSVSDTTDQVHWFSNSASFVDFLAPGGGITAAVPGGSYATLQGTSMATPHVAGAIALVRAAEPGMTVSQIKGLLLANSVGVLDSRNGIVLPRIDMGLVTEALEASELPDTNAIDSDGDGVADSIDNCPELHNPGQTDYDGDGVGDFCDLTPGC